ncbi:hypothetical protein ACP4OV_008196 [Aristida adscensionis]
MMPEGEGCPAAGSISAEEAMAQPNKRSNELAYP